MPTQCYSVSQPHIETLFAWIKSGEIAIPEIQRPFVWSAIQVRNLLDSLYRGYPVGYLIAWRNPDVRLKDGTSSSGKRILIDGQQRITALMAALLGKEVVNKDYQRIRIRIAFQPGDKKFEVSNPAIAKDASWISDIASVFDPNTSLFDLVNTYCQKNPGTTQQGVFHSLELLKGITGNQIGLIELASELDIETVAEIFIRVNSEGVPLSQADFAMSKIAVNETLGGNSLRKAIDYFCHLAVAPEFLTTIEHDTEFVRTDYYSKMIWLRDGNGGIYDPSYVDMLRVAFASEFKRGRLADLVALLSGRNFETKQYEEAIVEDSFARLRQGALRFMNETQFKSFVMIIRSAGFVDSALIGSQNALNFAYVLYLALREQGLLLGDIERHVRRWFVMSVLTGRYSGSPESVIDYDIRQIESQGIQTYAESLIRGELSEAFWDASLVQEMDTSVASSPYFRVFRAAQVKMGDRGFLSQDITVRELVEIKSDVHHVFPRDYLKKTGMERGQYNQIANYVVAQSEINIAIGNKEPRVYFTELLDQCKGGPKKYGNIVDIVAARAKCGDFHSMAEFLERTGVLREVADNLASAGVFDCLEGNRRTVKWEIGLRYRPVNSQLALLLPVEQDLVDLASLTDWERMKDEYSVLSLFPAGHIMSRLRPHLDKGVLSSLDVTALPDGMEVVTAGLVIRRQRPLGRAVFITLEDEFGHISLMVWPRIYERYENRFKAPFLVIKGKVSRRDGTENILVDQVQSSFSPFEKVPRAKNWG